MNINQKSVNMLNNKYKLFYSDRGFPLIFTGSCVKGKIVLTVENYLKWYSIYGVTESGEVIKINVELWDHRIPPDEVSRLSKINGYIFDECSLEVIIGRWHLESYEEESEKWGLN